MSNGSSALVDKLWNYCNPLRDGGLSCGDYMQQLTHLIFLKMTHEQTGLPRRDCSSYPPNTAWPPFKDKDGDRLDAQVGVSPCSIKESGGASSMGLGIQLSLDFGLIYQLGHERSYQCQFMTRSFHCVLLSPRRPRSRAGTPAAAETPSPTPGG